MKFFCKGQTINDGINAVIKALNPKKGIPILEGIKLSAEGSVITLSATDLELFIEKKITARITEEGEIVVPGRFFADYIKKLSNIEEIQFEKEEGDMLSIKYGNSEGRIQCMDADTFPGNQFMDENCYFEMEQREFKKLIEKVIFSVSTEDARPVLKGCYLEIGKDTISAVALDGYRFGYINKKLPLNNECISNIIVPARSLSEATKILNDTDEIMRVNVQKNMIMISTGDTKISTRLIENEYIQYKKIIPASFSSEAIIDKKLFLESIERASLVAKNKTNNYVRFAFTENELLITSNSDQGNIKESLPVKFNGKDMEIAFNSKFVEESLNVIDEDFIKFSFSTPTTPAIIRQIEGEDYIYLLLPVRVIG